MEVVDGVLPECCLNVWYQEDEGTLDVLPPWVWRLAGTDLRRIPAFCVIALRPAWLTSNLSDLFWEGSSPPPPSPHPSLPPPPLAPHPKYCLCAIRLGSCSQTSDRKQCRGNPPAWFCLTHISIPLWYLSASVLMIPTTVRLQKTRKKNDFGLHFLGEIQPFPSLA